LKTNHNKWEISEAVWEVDGSFAISFFHCKEPLHFEKTMIHLASVFQYQKPPKPNLSCSPISPLNLSHVGRDRGSKIYMLNKQINKALLYWSSFGNLVKYQYPTYKNFKKVFPILQFPTIQMDKIFPF
jgi:hypothetical protein